MQHLLRLTLVLTAALALAAGADAQPPQGDLAAQTNYTQARRPQSAIRFIVIHVTEGSYLGTVAWLRDPRAHASANFVVGRDGKVQELVPLHDIAWHAGNWAYNVRSVGIENVGYTDDPAGFTWPEYRASARLAAVIARRSLIPIDRRHIIGHYQVPNPNDPLQGGGIDSHTDPGRFWKWNLFMGLIRRFAYPERFVKHEHVGLQVESSTLYGGQTIAGNVPWRTRVAGPVTRVAFVPTAPRARGRATASRCGCATSRSRSRRSASSRGSRCPASCPSRRCSQGRRPRACCSISTVG
jgi:N-acetyl-anhydromuramyl-L-alanine amidase AmpD